MNKKGLAAELVKQVEEVSHLSKVASEGLVESLFGIIRNTIKTGDTVKIAGFGNFKVLDRAARDGRNPKTGAPVHIPACKKVKFKAAKDLKEAVL